MENKLKHAEAMALKAKDKAYKATDGKGLYLYVTKSGSKLWRQDYTLFGKRRTISLGRFPELGLAAARKKKDKIRALAKAGKDPVQERQQERDEQKSAAEYTFSVGAEAWLDVRSKTWSKSNYDSVLGRYEYNLKDPLGSLPMRNIRPRQILAVLRKIEARGTISTAHRCRAIVSQIFRFAIAGEAGEVESDPCRDLQEALVIHEEKEMAAITDPVEVGGLLRAIEAFPNKVVRAAMQLSALTLVRPGELRKMEWTEIKWINREWVIPAARMKTGKKMKLRGQKSFTVFLSDQAFDILQGLKKITGDGRYVFPAMVAKKKPMSSNVVLASIRRMGFGPDEMTAHGFRSMGSTLMNEWPDCNSELIDRQLAHFRKDIESRYNRAQLKKASRDLMQKYANYLDELRDGPSKSREATG